MMIPFRTLMFIFALITGMITSFSVFAQDESKPETYDRLDGTGQSKKRVDVVEWEGNLEVHVYPKASTKGLSAKLDDRTEGKKVMVIGYRFEGMKTPLVRRAILGVPFNAKLKAFIDSSEKEFDKLAISNHDLPSPWTRYKLDLPPKQWYPDGDPRNNEDDTTVKPFTLSDNADSENVKPLEVPAKAERKANGSPAQRKPASAQNTDDTDDGTIKNFSW